MLLSLFILRFAFSSFNICQFLTVDRTSFVVSRLVFRICLLATQIKAFFFSLPSSLLLLSSSFLFCLVFSHNGFAFIVYTDLENVSYYFPVFANIAKFNVTYASSSSSRYVCYCLSCRSICCCLLLL